MNSRDFLNTFTSLHALLSDQAVQGYLPNAKEDALKYLNSIESTIPLIVDLYLNEIHDVVSRAPKILATPTDFSTTQPFEDLAKFYGRNSTDLIRVWFKDTEGGYDSSTVEDRKAIYSKARDHYESKSAAPASGNSGNAPSSPRPTVVSGGGDKFQRKPDPCPDCNRKTVNTKYGPKLRCDEHDTWYKAP